MRTTIRKFLAVASLAAVLPGCALAQGERGARWQTPTTPLRPGHEVERLFYMVDNEDAYESFVAHADEITILGPQIYTVDSLGVVFGSLDPRVKALADEKGIKVMPLLVNEGFNQQSLRKLLANPQARQRSINSLVNLCREHGYWGIQFDVENVNIDDTDAFVSWFEEAADSLHANGYAISIAVVHRLQDEAGPNGYARFLQDSWRGAFDMERIGRAADIVTVMTYDQHTRRTPPGPVSSLPWMREVMTYFLERVPAEKLSLGIPLYSERWLVTYDGSLPSRAASSSQTMSWNRARQIVDRYDAEVRWDPKLGVEWGYYVNGGVFEWIFIEDARAFEARVNLAQELGVRGFSAWVLGPEDPGIWEVLSGR